MKDGTEMIRVANCMVPNYSLTRGKFYIIQDEYEDLIDKDINVFVINDLKLSIPYKKTRFMDFRTVTRQELKELNEVKNRS
jgi:phage pi2 protein 07